MVRLSKRSKISHQRRRRSQIRGGKPPKAKAEPLTLITGRDGSFCSEKPENDCIKIKACDWMPANARQKGYCRTRQDRGTGEISQQFKEMEELIQQRRTAARLELLQTSDEELELITPPVPKGKPSPKVSPRSTSPAQLRRVAAKALGEDYVPVKSSKGPLGCIAKEYEMTSANGKPFKTTRCVDSKDREQNDTVNCMINPETNKCKSRKK